MKNIPRILFAVILLVSLNGTCAALADHHEKGEPKKSDAAPLAPAKPTSEKPVVKQEAPKAEAKKPEVSAKQGTPQKKLFHAGEAIRHLNEAGLQKEADALKGKVAELENVLNKQAEERKELSETRHKEMEEWQMAQSAKLESFRKRVEELKGQLESVQKGLAELTAEPAPKIKP